MEETPVVLTVAGSDSGGGAGIQADLKTLEACGVFGASAVTALTAQNTVGVQAVEPVPAEFVSRQIDSVVDDLPVEAAKTGMLGEPDVVAEVASKVAEHDVDTVVDPVMVAESGDRLLTEGAEELLREELLPEAALVTPNAEEARVLTGTEVDTTDDLEEAAKALVEMGADAALVKGGHVEDDGSVVDVLHSDGATTELHKPRVETDDTHGTGCTLSSAIAAYLARDSSVEDAVAAAEDLIYRALEYGHGFGEGSAPVRHGVELSNQAQRHQVLKQVRKTLAELEDADVSPVVPEVGLNFAVATSYAVDEDDVAAFEGRMTRTSTGVASHGVALAASGHVARFLLATREHDPGLQAACNVRNTEEIRGAVSNRWNAVEFDRTGEPETVNTMEWSAAQAFQAATGTPDAVVDSGAVGKEPMVRLLADDPVELREMVVELADTV